MEHAWPMLSRCTLATVLTQSHQSQQQPHGLPAVLCRLLHCSMPCSRGWPQAAPAWWQRAARRQRSRAQLSPCGQVGRPDLPLGCGWPLLLQSRGSSHIRVRALPCLWTELSRSASELWQAPSAAEQGLSPLTHGLLCCIARVVESSVVQLAERSPNTLVSYGVRLPGLPYPPGQDAIQHLHLPIEQQYGGLLPV